MIYIVHGDDTVKSRALIVNQYKKLGSTTKVTLEIKNTTPNEFYEQSATSTLFGEAPLVVLDITDAGRQNVDNFIEAAKKIPSASNTIIFSSKALSKSNAFIANAQKLNAKIIENTFESDANIFRFTDTLLSKNRTAVYKELNKLLKADTDPFYIFSMILYGIRNVAKIVLKSPSADKLKPFQVTKLAGMSKNLDADKIKLLFKSLYSYEIRSKTGGISPEMLVTLSIEKVLNS